MACERLLSATANGIYQGMIVAAFAALALKMFARTNAATRHAVWFGVLLFVTALIPAHLLLSLVPRHGILTAAQRTSPAEIVIASTASPDGISTGAPKDDTDVSSGQLDAGSSENVLSSSANGQQDQEATAKLNSPSRAIAEVTEWTWWHFAKKVFNPLAGSFETAIRLPHWICVCLVSLWVLLASIRGWLIARGIGDVRRAKASSSAPSQSLQTLFDRLCASLVARRDVRLRLGGGQRTAMVLGFFHPVILLPTGMDNDPNDREVEHVLRHELAHVDRRDDWGNLAQQLIQAVLFFHPAVWWISKRLVLEREIACDDRVLEASGRPREYALTLANVASRMVPSRHALAPGVSNNRSQLTQRINMILNTRRDHSPRLARRRLGFFAITTAILATIAIAAGPRLVVAQSAPDTTPPTPPTPDLPAAATPPATLSPDATVESGPRPKWNRISPGGALPLAATLSVSAVAATPPTPGLAPVAAEPDVRPVPPAAPLVRSRKRSMSIEERLDRIERVLEELEARDGTKVRPGSVASVAELRAKIAAERMVQDSRLAPEAAERAAVAGKLAAEDAQRNVDRAMRDLVKLRDNDFQRLQKNLSELEAEAPQRALEALRKAHESLGKQMQDLERQIRRLEEDQNRLKKPARGRPESSDEAPKANDPFEQAK